MAAFSFLRRVAVALIAVFAVGLLAGCGGSDEPPLSPVAAEGRDVVRASGCAACHGPTGGGGVGPPWTGRYGTVIELDGGGSVTVDDDYLRRAITQPDLEQAAGYTVVMPQNPLEDDQVEAVVAYIRELSEAAQEPTP
jgi:cytochrome c oxidase subunit 2